MISKAVLVTGCSSGIGRATALRLAEAGWPVWATARRTDGLDDLAAAGCRLLSLDVTDEESMSTAVAAVTEESGAVGVLVNNAGYSQSGPVEEVSMDKARQQFETNVFGPARLAQLVLPGMRAQAWGRIVNVSSMGGRFTFPGGGWYHASKHALESLSDALRFEVAGFGVAVILVEPGLIRTGFDTAAVGAMDAAEDGAPPAGPYGHFSVAVARSTSDVYTKGPLAKLGGGPEVVAEAILKAIEARSPRARYRVTPSARVLLTLRRLTPDRGWDALLRQQFPQPG